MMKYATRQATLSDSRVMAAPAGDGVGCTLTHGGLGAKQRAA